MACKTTCRLCDRLAISTAVAYTSGTGVVVTIPQATYDNGEKVCIVVAQSLPPAATIASPVYIKIGTGETLYPLTRCDCGQVTICGIKTRTRYSTRVVTTASGGSFRMMGKPCDCQSFVLQSIGG